MTETNWNNQIVSECKPAIKISPDMVMILELIERLSLENCDYTQVTTEYAFSRYHGDLDQDTFKVKWERLIKGIISCRKTLDSIGWD